MPTYTLTEEYKRLLDALLIEWRSGRLSIENPRPGRREPSGPSPHILCCLAEPLESGGTARAVLLRRSARPVQLVTISGIVTAGKFKLHWGPFGPSGPDPQKTSGAIAYNASARQFQKALEQIDEVQPDDVAVTLGHIGLDDGTTANLGRWAVEFTGITNPPLLQPFFDQEASLDGGLNNVTAETHFLVGTDSLETVAGVIPVGDPTPLVRGAFAAAIPFPRTGYGVVAIECRDFSTADDPYSPYP